MAEGVAVLPALPILNIVTPVPNRPRQYEIYFMVDPRRETRPSHSGVRIVLVINLEQFPVCKKWQGIGTKLKKDFLK